MGIIADLSDFIVIASNNYIFVMDKKAAESNVNTLELPDLKKSNSENLKTASLNSSDDIVSLIASKDEKFIAVATQEKRLIIWNVSTWSVHKEEALVKRPMAIAFSADATAIIVADKNGDVYSYPLNAVDVSTDNKSFCEASGIDVEPGPEPLLGHFSMLLDLALTNDDEFLITCDRDEKIRVSSYPNCYNIHTYCLGHTEFVSHLRLLPNNTDRLLSASGDGKIIFWNYLKGKASMILDVRDKIEILLRSCFDLEEASDDQLKAEIFSSYISNLEVTLMSSEKYLLAVAFYRLPILLFYKMDCSKEKFSYLYCQKLSFPPLDFRFLEEGELLVFLNTSLQEDEKSSLAIFQFSEEFREIHVNSQHFLLKIGRDYREKLKPKNVFALDANSLFKHNKYDNVAVYLRKKEERLSSNRTNPIKRKSSEIQ